MALSGQKILLGVTGSIAAYKAAELVRLLTGAGHEVRVVMTPSARKFIGETTFQALSGRRVLWDQFATGEDQAFAHIELAKSDLAVIAPATAGTIGKMAAGLADNLLLSALLATDCPVIVCPAMNSRMWNHPAVRENVQTLARRGVIMVSPEAGDLACGEQGEGRLADVQRIFQEVDAALAPASSNDFAGRRIIITAGATREPIDSVRYVSNRSSGRMGFAMARAARRRGARVTVIAANCSLEREPGVRCIDVSTSEEMRAALNRELDVNDVLIMSAAVADYKVLPGGTPGKIERKLKNDLKLVPTADIVSSFRKGSDRRLTVGFAAEYGRENMERAREKLKEKNLDMIVFNDVSRSDVGFESEDNEIVIMAPGREDVFVSKTSKFICAERILDQIRELLDVNGTGGAHEEQGKINFGD
ncbi:MAG: bifunctional phosphopantothenoylcysteine decarboxylase/phosphopantothenate--cysteine ligase CoaBC [Thermoleophilia bacterium]|nr:bifunctional phosphopantothenoylcysteine decarboxylase/phosphopantothenate--cysteine ligase CoaBC [Thermoleophilia bacterium]